MSRIVAWAALVWGPFAWQAKAEVEFRWSLDRDLAADYQVFELKGGRPVPQKDRSIVVYGSELREDGTSSLMVNSFDDIGPYFLFMLPKGKVKVGSKWATNLTVFKDARFALTSMHCYRELNFVGGGFFRKHEKVHDRDCAVIEGVYQYFELKIDSQGRKKPSNQPTGTLRVTQWLTPGQTELLRGSWELEGRDQEYKGIKQGEEPKGGNIDDSHLIELKKEPVKLALKDQNQPIADAVKKGVAALRRMQEQNGSFVDRGGSFAREFPVGVSALALMALLHSGVKEDDPVLRSGMAFVQGQSLRRTYEVAASLMLLETKYLPLEKVQDIAELTEEKARSSIQAAITPADRAFVEKCAHWLVERQTKTGTWGYPEAEESKDHSNTQYALLGLKAASRMGVQVPDTVWKKAADHWLEWQRVGGNKVALKVEGYPSQDPVLAEGSPGETFSQGEWGYLVKKIDNPDVFDQGYGSMTCAGLTSLMIAGSELALHKALDDSTRKQIDLAMKQGLAWLQENYSIRGAPPSAGFWSLFYFYYLYSLERVGVLCGIRTLGGHDWYLEGAVLLCHSQREDGSWLSYDEIPVLDTSFALLFLKRATLRVASYAMAAPPKPWK